MVNPTPLNCRSSLTPNSLHSCFQTILAKRAVLHVFQNYIMCNNYDFQFNGFECLEDVNQPNAQSGIDFHLHVCEGFRTKDL